MQLSKQSVKVALENCVLNNSDTIRAMGDATKTYTIMCATPHDRDYVFAAAQAWVDGVNKALANRPFQILVDQLNERLPMWGNNKDAREAITPILQMAEMAEVVQDALRWRALVSSGLHIDAADVPHVTGQQLQREADLLLKGK